MNSIDKNQTEKTHQNLKTQDAINKIIELGEGKTCFLCTSQDARPMTVQKVDSEGFIWFLSASDSTQNKEIGENNIINLYFQGNQHSDFMHLYGKAQIIKDKSIIEELWNPIFKTWFTEGKNDSRISIIKFETNNGYYWDNKHGNLIAGLKILIGAATGNTLDDSIQGELKN